MSRVVSPPTDQAPGERAVFSEVIEVANKRVRIDVTSDQVVRLRAVFADATLPAERRRRMAKRILPLPSDGTPVDLYHEGQFVGAL